MRFNHNPSFALDYLAMDGERLTEAETGGGEDGGARRPEGDRQGGEPDAQAALAHGQGPAGPGQGSPGGARGDPSRGEDHASARGRGS